MVIFPHILWVCSNRLTWQQFPPERSALLDFHLRFRAKVLKQRFAGSITAKSLKYRHGVPIKQEQQATFPKSHTSTLNILSHLESQFVNHSALNWQTGRSAMSARIIWVEKCVLRLPPPRPWTCDDLCHNPAFVAKSSSLPRATATGQED